VPLRPLIAIASAALCLGACSASAKPSPPLVPSPDEPVPSGSQLSEFGATIADWNATHRQDPRVVTGKAYNPGFVDYHNGDAPQDQFIDVFSDNTRIIRFTEQFPRRTDLAAAHLGVLAELPRDAAMVGLLVPGACRQELYSSRTLGGAFGSANPEGLVLVEYKSGEPGSVPISWDPSDVTAGTLSVGTNWLNPQPGVDVPPC
jgi:hypothetical protein